MALWGLIVAAALLIGSLPFFIGLAIDAGPRAFDCILSQRSFANLRPGYLTDWPKEGMDQLAHYSTLPHSFLFPWPKD